MAKTINILPAVQVNESAVTVDVEITEGGHTRTDQYAFNANDFDCNCSSSNPYVAKFMFEPGDITMILDVQGDFTTCQFDGVTKASAYALAQDVIADIGQYASAGGGSPYTFPTNHGNTAYVSVDGNDGTGELGNISKPFENIGAAIAALDNAVDGVIIILSSSSAQVINDYDYSTMPYNLSIFDFANTGLACGGSCSFGTLKVRTAGIFLVNTDFLYASDDYCDIQCDTLLIQSTAQGAITFLGIVECNNFLIPSNTNNPSITFDIIKWNKSIIEVSEPITYNRCNPMVYKAILSQSGTSAPTATVLENSTGETVSTAYTNSGQYLLKGSVGKYLADKVMVTFGANNYTGGAISRAFFGWQRLNNTDIEIKSFDGDGFESDGIITELPITIEIYP